MVPMKPAKPELTLGEPKKWNITGKSTPPLQMLMISANFLRCSSFNLFLTSEDYPLVAGLSDESTSLTDALIWLISLST